MRERERGGRERGGGGGGGREGEGIHREEEGGKEGRQ